MKKRKHENKGSKSPGFGQGMSPEMVLIELQKIIESDSLTAAKAASLMAWYRTHGKWTPKQWAYVQALALKNRVKTLNAKINKPKSYYLYAISDGRYVKLGYSCKPRSRLKSMQTGHPQPLELVWTLEAGSSEAEAAVLERKLHRYCGDFQRRSEWFDLGCMELVRKFVVKEKEERQREDELQELEIVCTARAYI